MTNEVLQTESNEVGLRDIVGFLKSNLKRIAVGGLLGLLFSLAYVVLTPNKYEARLQLQMAQFVQSNSNSNSNSESNNSEEPAALIQRLRIPTVYPVNVQQKCGMPENGEFGDYLGGVLKVAVVKNVASAVEMTVSGPSSSRAKECAEAIVAMVTAQQRSQIEDRLVGRQAQVMEYKHALLEEQQQLEKIRKSELGNFGYLAKLDKMSWLRARIDALHEEALLSQLHPAKLVSPIFAPSRPVSPRVKLVLLLGMMAGLMLGLLYALGREGWRRSVA